MVKVYSKEDESVNLTPVVASLPPSASSTELDKGSQGLPTGKVEEIMSLIHSGYADSLECSRCQIVGKLSLVRTKHYSRFKVYVLHETSRCYIGMLDLKRYFPMEGVIKIVNEIKGLRDVRMGITKEDSLPTEGNREVTPKGILVQQDN